MNAQLPVRAATERNIHDIWAEEEAALPTPAQRLARAQAFAAECDKAWEAGAPRREREDAAKQARADAQFAQLSRQFCKAFGVEEPKVLRERGQ